MKQTLRVYGCLLGLFLVTSLRAQTGPGTRSRLELGRSKPTPLSSDKFKNFPFLRYPQVTSLDRAVTLHKSLPINDYYRSLLIAPAPAKVTLTRQQAAQPESTANAVVQAESRPVVTESLRSSEDRLFANEHVVVSNVYPNPAAESAEIDYQLTAGDARLTLLNILGAPVAEYSLDPADRKLRIATRTMETGVYFYQLSVDGRKVATKKLLVRHQ